MRGPPITITCDCGETGRIRYGGRWECETCGRRWNTAQIPVGEYEGLIRDLRRYRIEVFVIALAIVAIFIPLIVFVNQALTLMLPILLAALAIFYGPFWKRKVRRRIAAAPRWELHPE